MFRLFSQLKKNQEYSDLLARIMLETEQNIKNSFMLSRFDILISDMNELLSEFLQRERLVSAEQIESLWVKVQNGGKWAFGKVVIENYNRQPTFRKKVYTDASSDNMLAGTIMEFCARYQTLIALLEKHDKEKIFINVIDNALKYNQPGGNILIEQKCEDGCVQITVSDTGVGIAAQDIDRVKEKFYKANKQVRGSGIGLAVADEIIKLHDGEMKINSVLGEGTTVTVTLPVEVSEVSEPLSE